MTSGLNNSGNANHVGSLTEVDVLPTAVMEDSDLNLNGVVVYDQRRLEQGVMDQMNQAFNERKKAMETRRAKREIKLVHAEIREVTLAIRQADRTLEMVSSDISDKETKKRIESVKCKKTNKEKQLKMLQAKLKRLQKTAGISPADDPGKEIPDEDVEKAAASSASWALTGKSDEERQRLIKLGLMTPFGSMIADEEEKEPKKKRLALDDGFGDFLTSQNVTKKAAEKPKRLAKPVEKSFKIPKKKNVGLKSWIHEKNDAQDLTDSDLAATKRSEVSVSRPTQLEKTTSPSKGDEYIPDEKDFEIEREDFEEEKLMQDTRPRKKPRYNADTGEPVFDYDDSSDSVSIKKAKVKSCQMSDDGKLSNYQKRIARYRAETETKLANGERPPDDKQLDNDYRVPGEIWSRLYKYQRTGVRWLCELHSQKVGGILGDEMGLGKTVQIIAFLATLRLSKLRSRSIPGYPYEGLGPVLIVTPTTVMHQWVKEFHKWAPMMRVAVLHDSGNYESSRAQLVDHIARNNGVLITSYERARINVEMLLDHGWHYVILDEGHKIRNPDAAVTVALKMFRTPHRLILSGSPVQNNLKELWSLFDFIFPGKLGILPVFMEQFSIPIVQGGYSNATEIQVHTAYKCACKLRDTISPYLLRRMKRDVQLSLELPSKNEQVLFCWLSQDQVEVYTKYLESDQVHSILTREMKVFAGLIQLRKICNHPDLYTGGPKIMVGEATPSPRDRRSFGYYKRSGKMLVIASLLKSWKKQGHKVLLFTQSKTMLDVLEIYLSSRGYTYLTMHGGTPVRTRQPLINQFNTDPSLFVFLLTTRVGGLGVNLTGANRVVIYDPDWNPSTDSQAQERAWRIGQRRDVTIYRLLTLGTIEEKIYHRQIFKQFLTNRVLKDPWQRRFFKSNDLHELFILKDYGPGRQSHSKDDGGETRKTETAAIFAGTGSEVRPETVRRNATNRTVARKRTRKVSGTGPSIDLPPENEELETGKDTSPDTFDSNSIASEEKTLQNEPNNLELGNGVTTCVSNSKAPDLTQGSNGADGCSEDAAGKTTSLRESLLRAREKFERLKSAETADSGKVRKQKRKKKNVVEGETVKNLAAVEAYKSNRGASEEIEQKSRKATDDYVLHRLFKRAGVHSAMQHNTIMDSAHPDYALVEVEAERVAKESVRNLKLSRRQYRYPTGRQAASNTKPRFGNKKLENVLDKDDSAILKAEKRKDDVFQAAHLKTFNDDDKKSETEVESSTAAPLSASQLLSVMRRRNHEEIHKQEEEDSAQQDEERDMFGFSVSQPDGGVSVAVNPTEHDEMMEDLRNFIAFGCSVDGQAKTSEIMAQFGSKILPSHAAIFKSILKELCTSGKLPGSDETVWFLKADLR